MIQTNIYSDEIVHMALEKFGVQDSDDKIVNVDFYFTDSGIFKVKIEEEPITTGSSDE